MDTKLTFRDKVRDPKVHLALGLMVAVAGFLAPKDSQSYCAAGNAGDCVILTSGNTGCSAGAFWNDCK